MVPIIYPHNNINFKTLGKGKITGVSRCIVHEELNGDYSIELDYPVTGERFQDLIAGGVIGAIAPSVARLNYKRSIEFFDIDKFNLGIDGMETFHGSHISRRLSRTVYVYQSLSAGTYKRAWEWSLPYDMDGLSISQSQNPFTGTIDIPAPKSALACLIGENNSLKADIGGEFAFSSQPQNDGTIILYIDWLAARGANNGDEIRFGINMTDVNLADDQTQAFNAVIPYWDDQFVTGYIVQPTTPISPVIAVPLDLRTVFQNQPTENDMITYARNYLDTAAPWNGDRSLTVDFVNGAEIDPHGAEIQLGDTVHVSWLKAGISTDLRVVAYDYDVLSEKYVKMQLGTPSTEFVATTKG